MTTALLVAGLLLPACSSTSSQLKGRFARERSCPVDRVVVVERGANLYTASGCGQSASYVCSTFASMDENPPCEEQGSERNASGAEPPVRRDPTKEIPPGPNR